MLLGVLGAKVLGNLLESKGVIKNQWWSYSS